MFLIMNVSNNQLVLFEMPYILQSAKLTIDNFEGEHKTRRGGGNA